MYLEAMTEYIQCLPIDRFGVGRAVRAKKQAKTIRILPDNPIAARAFAMKNTISKWLNYWTVSYEIIC